MKGFDNVVVKINGEALGVLEHDDLWYCKDHDKWNWEGFQCKCCVLEMDVLLEAEEAVGERWAAVGVKVGRLTNADKWQLFFQGI